MQVLITLTVRLQSFHDSVLKVCLELVGVIGDVYQEAEDVVDETKVCLAPFGGL